MSSKRLDVSASLVLHYNSSAGSGRHCCGKEGERRFVFDFTPAQEYTGYIRHVQNITAGCVKHWRPARENQQGHCEACKCACRGRFRGFTRTPFLKLATYQQTLTELADTRSLNIVLRSAVQSRHFNQALCMTCQFSHQSLDKLSGKYCSLASLNSANLC